MSPVLAAPVTIRGRTAPSRVVFGPHETNLARRREISDRHVAYYARRAEGGAGLIVTEVASVHDSDHPYDRAPLAADCGPGWADVVRACRPHGTLVLAGLGHAGGQGSTAYGPTVLWGPSRVADVASREVPMEMEAAEIDALVRGFADAAALAVRAGLDGVEVNAGQHSVLRQFLSGLTNHRTDAYGQDRDRLLREVLAAARAALGEDRILGLRLCADELAPWAGITPEQAGGTAASVAGRIDYLVPVRGSAMSVHATRPDLHTPPGFNRRLCAQVRAALGPWDAPPHPTASHDHRGGAEPGRSGGETRRADDQGRSHIVLQGSVVDPAFAQAALDDGVADLVEMTRAQIAEPDLVALVRAGTPERIRPCTLSNQRTSVRDTRNPLVSDDAEPDAGHELDDPTTAIRSRTADSGASQQRFGSESRLGPPVLVVGGGPAGLEAALVAARRGCRVRLVERSGELGGALRLAAAVEGRSRFGLLIRWWERELARLGVDVRLSRSIDRAGLDAAERDGFAVLLATGSRPGPRPYPSDGVVLDAASFEAAVLAAGSTWAALDGLPAGRVVVHDPIGDWTGVGVAEQVAVTGRPTTIVSPDQVAGTQLARTGDLAPANARLERAGVVRELRSVLRGVRGGIAELEHVWTGERRETACALVIDCGHRMPEESLWLTHPHLLRAGDCVAPRTVYEAVLEGRRAARSVGGCRPCPPSVAIPLERGNPAQVRRGQDDPAPVRRGQDDPAPVRRGQDDPAPVRRGQDDPAPVRRGQDDPAPVRRGQDDPAPVRRGQDDPAPVRRGHDDPAPVRRERGHPAAVHMTGRLHSPLQLGPLTLRNRIVFSAHLTDAAVDGLPTAQHAAYYAARAAGGAGLVITEEHSVHPADRPYEKLIRGHDPAVLPGYRRLTVAVHAHGVPVLAQLNHNGGQSSGMYSRAPVWAPSPQPDPMFREVPKAVTIAEIREIVEGYAQVAGRCAAGGFDGVELQCSHASLLRQFLSPLTNLRTDGYGGSLENRVRIVREVVAAVRAAIGPGRVIGVRLCGDEGIPGGTPLAEAVETARILERDIDYLNTSIGVATSTLHLVEAPMPVRPGYALFIPSAIRAAVSLPVIGVGRFTDHAQAEQALAQRHCDLVGVVRGQIADPGFASGPARVCVACNQECVARVGLNQRLGCLVNPRAGREAVALPPPTVPGLRVLVVGGGPAGLAAAAAAAGRGHHVVLCEREPAVGGQVTVAASAPGRGEFGNVTRDLLARCHRAGVEIRAGVAVDPSIVDAERPDVVVLATGARPAVPAWGGGLERVVDVRDVLTGRSAPAGDVLVYDELGFHQATSAAELLAGRGCTVEITTPGMVVGQDLGLTLDMELFHRRAHAAGIVQTTDRVIVDAATDGEKVVVTVLHHPVGTRTDTTYDWVVCAVPPTPEDGLWHALRDRGVPVHRIGDCLAPRRAHAAIAEGERVAQAL